MYKNYKDDPSTLVPEDQFMMKVNVFSSWHRLSNNLYNIYKGILKLRTDPYINPTECQGFFMFFIFINHFMLPYDLFLFISFVR